MPHRPLQTFTYFEDSVYCLYTQDPYLDTFWTGGRDGWVMKMSKMGWTSGGMDVVAVCKEDSAVNKVRAVGLWVGQG